MATRIGKPLQGTVATTSRVDASITDSVSDARLLTQTCLPSGVVAIPSAPAPVVISVSLRPPSRSIAVTLPEPMLATKARFPSGVVATM